ncbi:unnamed protein product, partial [marine sediment metagenome]
HSDVYARNEENMLDWNGNMVEPKDRVRVLLSDIEEDTAMVASATVSMVETQAIDRIASEAGFLGEALGRAEWDTMPDNMNEVSSIMASVSPLLDPSELAYALSERAVISKFAVSVGATNAYQGDYLFDSPSVSMDGPTTGEIDLDEYFTASATHAEAPKGVSVEQLSKVWRIDLETAKRTLDVTTQRCKRSENPTLSRNYSTNDRMLRYKRISQHFFMDTFFASKKSGKSSRGNSCMQLFVSDKGFIYVVPMQSKSQVPQALKMFAKEVGAPDAVICDAAREQISKEVKHFCHQMGTTLRVLEENTPWANRAELYIGLVKEGIRKDMKDSNCPLVFWDYCAERRARVNNLTAKKLFQLEGQNAHYSVTG